MTDIQSFVLYAVQVIVLLVLGYIIWRYACQVSMLEDKQFDPEIHVRRQDLEDHIDLLSLDSDIFYDDWPKGTIANAYRCGYQAALKAVDKYLKEHASDSFTDKNKHDV
jgi:hypothetical protein